MRKMNSNSNNWDVIFVAILAVLIYLAFTPLFDQSESLIASETLSAALGAILAAAFTWALLTRQTKEARSKAVLDVQLQIFTSQMSQLAEIIHLQLDQTLENKDLSPAELKKLHHKLLTARIPMEVIMPAEASSKMDDLINFLEDQITYIETGDQPQVGKALKNVFIPTLHELARICGRSIGISTTENAHEIIESPQSSNDLNKTSDLEQRPTINPNEKIMAITINNPSSDAEDLMEKTGSAWRLNRDKANQANFILSVSGGICYEVYIADSWLPATVENFPKLQENIDNRFGFVGQVAPDQVRNRFVGKPVPIEFIRKRGSANPVQYSWDK